MWYKPAAALANPHEAIPVSKQAYKSFLDFEVHFPFENIFNFFAFLKDYGIGRLRYICLI
jgi:hypothetical protein